MSRRVREFGTLKALGWRGRRIIAQVMGESFVLGVLGAGIGVGLGFAGAAIINAIAPSLSATLSQPTGEHIMTPNGALNPTSSHTVSVPLVASVSGAAILAAVVLAVAGGLLAGMFGELADRPAAPGGRTDEGGVTAMYELTGVGKAYTTGSRKVLAVSGVDLTVSDGEWLAIRGRTGHGKSTLLNLLGGLDRPTPAQLLLDGRDLGRMRTPSSPGCALPRSASSSRRSTWCRRCPPRRTWKRRCPAAGGRQARRPYSGRGAGQRRAHRPGPAPAVRAVRRPAARVAIARALVKEPKVGSPTSRQATWTRRHATDHRADGEAVARVPADAHPGQP